jgi:predicted small lipoprotein YifL
MVRQLARHSLALLCVAALSICAGCGIKGPLVPPPATKTLPPPQTQTIPPATVQGNPEQRKP